MPPTSSPCSFPGLWLAALGLLAEVGAQDAWLDKTPLEVFSSPLAYDHARQRVMHFGGIGVGAGPELLLDRSAQWDGAAWRPLTTADAPPPRDGHALASDGSRQRVVLFGGAAGRASPFFPPRTLLADTWEWDGSSWRDLTPSSASPIARFGHAMAFDRARRRVVLFGGTDGSQRLGDTWEWDGGQWQQHSPAVTPPPRTFHTMAYDPVRRRVVLFGGEDQPTAASLGDMWEWDGSAWAQLNPPVLPPAKTQAAMTCDSARQRVLLYGGGRCCTGADDETWEWDGTRWRRLDPTNRPSILFLPGMAEDVATQTVLLFGGAAGNWTWDGTNWTHHPPTLRVLPSVSEATMTDHEATQRVLHVGGWYFDIGLRPDPSDRNHVWDGFAWTEVSAGPSARGNHTATYDRDRQRVVLFGGSDRWNSFGDTWEWDGVGWREVTAPGPSARSRAAMAYDAARRQTVLFGGYDPTALSYYYGYPAYAGARMADTWVWDGASWTELTPATSPPRSSAHTMAYDAARRRVVLHDPDSGTWEWDGVDWRQRITTGPTYGNMVYDSGAGRIVYHEGHYGGQTWTWDGASWTSLALPATPPRRSGHAMAYDAARQRIVVAGGFSAGLVPGYHGHYRDTWLLGTTQPAQATTYGSGCGGPNGPPFLAGFGLPRLASSSFTLDLGGAPPLAPAVIFFAAGSASVPIVSSCTALVDVGRWQGHVSVNTTTAGQAALPLRVPRAPALIGVDTFGQGAVLDPYGPWQGISLSNGLRLTIGE
ncbi:MAG: kelch repeat-containing protein [Planctomycetota bacterium]